MPRGLWAEYWAMIPATEARRQMSAAIAAMAPAVAQYEPDTIRQWFSEWQQVINESAATRYRGGIQRVYRTYDDPSLDPNRDVGPAGPIVHRWKQWLLERFHGGEIRD